MQLRVTRPLAMILEMVYVGGICGVLFWLILASAH
jgi:hypothetical protein